MSDYSNWMSDRASSIGDKYLWQIAIPGTHDSGTQPVNGSSEFGSDASDSLKNLRKYYHYFPLGDTTAGEYIAGWCRAQDNNIQKQLIDGIRYFDLRVCMRHDLDQIWITHSMMCQEVADVFSAVSDFLAKHPKEIVILDINHFYGMNDHLKNEFARWINSKYSSHLLYPSDKEKITLRDKSIKEIWQAGRRMIVIYHDSDISGKYDPSSNKYSPGSFLSLWSGDFIHNPWPNRMDNDRLMARMDKFMQERQSLIEQRQPKGQMVPLFVLQCQRTPSSDGCTFATGLTAPGAPHSLRDLAKQTTPETTKHLNTYKGKKVNCFITDCYQITDYVETVLNFN